MAIKAVNFGNSQFIAIHEGKHLLECRNYIFKGTPRKAVELSNSGKGILINFTQATGQMCGKWDYKLWCPSKIQLGNTSYKYLSILLGKEYVDELIKQNVPVDISEISERAAGKKVIGIIKRETIKTKKGHKTFYNVKDIFPLKRDQKND